MNVRRSVVGLGIAKGNLVAEAALLLSRSVAQQGAGADPYGGRD